MHIKFLDLLCDPLDKSKLTLTNEIKVGNKIISGKLESNNSSYEIINGIPRFVSSKNYSSSFGFEWHRWPKVQFESENINKPMENHTRNMFDKITEFQENISGEEVFILDMGVGAGRFADIALEKKFSVIGVDYSNAIDVAASNLNYDNRDDILLIQADALSLPIKNKMVNYVYSIGVLHHTPNPLDGVKESYRVLKNEGEFALCVYGKSSHYDFITTQLWRKFFNILSPLAGNIPPLIYTYFAINLIWPIARISRILSLPLRLLLPIANLPDKKWSYLDTFDSITPSYQSTHTAYEIWRWLDESKFRKIRPTNWDSTAVKGIKVDI